MARTIKEIIIVLVICLISMLTFAIILYEYIPNRKVVPEVETYTASTEIETLLADDIDSKENEVVLTYEVSSRDLTSYEATNQYVPGKANPFAAVEETSTDTNSSKNTTNSSNTNSSSGSTTQENDTETNSFIDDGGAK